MANTPMLPAHQALQLINLREMNSDLNVYLWILPIKRQFFVPFSGTGTFRSVSQLLPQKKARYTYRMLVLQRRFIPTALERRPR